MASSIVTTDFKNEPYWWEAVPRAGSGFSDLPHQVDCLIVGSGVTGLHCALELARGGRETLVIDAEEIGHGASTRNNGTIVPYLYLKQYQLEKKFGPERGVAIARTALDSIDYLLDFVKREKFDSGITRNDRYFLSLTRAQYEGLVHSAELQNRGGLATGWQPIDAAALTSETGLRGFVGGVASRGSLAMHPALFHAGSFAACLSAGVKFADRTRALLIRSTGSGFVVTATRGIVKARDVVVATNGYTGPEIPWARRRLMDVRVFMAATEPMPEDIRRQVFPGPRLFVDSKTNITWVRISPDGTRVLVGGRAGMKGDDPEAHAAILHDDMARLIPALAPLRMTHCWFGRMGFSFDLIPHIGTHNGIHYALGFCGVGMTLGSWLGNRLGRRILGASEDDAAVLAREPFSGRFWYRGGTLAMAAAMSWIDLKDRWETRSWKPAS